MSQAEPKVVRLEPMRVASAWAFGPQPEDPAWKLMKSWAGAKGLLTANGPAAPRMFGFNNPNPSAGSPNYGYEFLITVGPEVEPADGIRIREQAGGLYLVMPCNVNAGDPNVMIPEAWKRLDAWAAAHNYRHGAHQWLEEHNLEGKLQALYYPIAE